MITYIKITLGIFLALAASRFIPHPPNFTSLIALSFYVPVFFGTRFIPAVLFSFVITDLVIGFHSTIFWTWSTIIIIGLLSNYFKDFFTKRIIGVLFGCTIFFLATNFGVWTTGYYGYTLEGIINCYILAIPFFGTTLIATIIYSIVISISENLTMPSATIVSTILGKAIPKG